jgi:hypothetical protein
MGLGLIVEQLIFSDDRVKLLPNEGRRGPSKTQHSSTEPVRR